MNVYADLYSITPPGPWDVSFEWDDSIVVAANEELEKRILLMQNGITSKVETRMWYFGETERQALEALSQVDKEQQQQQRNDLSMMMQYDINNREMNGDNPYNNVKHGRSFKSQQGQTSS